ALNRVRIFNGMANFANSLGIDELSENKPAGVPGCAKHGLIARTPSIPPSCPQRASGKRQKPGISCQTRLRSLDLSWHKTICSSLDRKFIRVLERGTGRRSQRGSWIEHPLAESKTVSYDPQGT